MTVINKVKKFLHNHCYSIGFFAFLWIYAYVVVGKFSQWEVFDIVYSFHAVDFSMGFASKILMGAIYNFFFNELTMENVVLFDKIVLCIIFATSAVLIEKILLNTDEKYRKTAMFIMLFFVTGTPTFAAYVFCLGMLDTFFVVFSLLFIIFLSYKYSRWFLIIPLVGVLMTHYASMICFVPSLVILGIYKISCLEKKGEKISLWIPLVVATVAVLALFVYLLLFETENMVYTLEEFSALLKSKGVEHLEYYEAGFYREVINDSGVYDDIIVPDRQTGVARVFDTIIQQIQLTFSMLNINFGMMVFIGIAPVTYFLFRFLFVHIKKYKRENKLKAFSFVCMCLMFVVTLSLAGFVSSDSVRWVNHAFFSLFASVLYILYNEGSESWEYVDTQFSKTPVVLLVFYFLMYANFLYSPYM